MTSGRDLAYDLVVDHHALVVASNAAIGNLESNKLPFYAVCFLLDQRFAPDEITFVEFANPTEICFVERSVFVDLVAIEGHA